MPRHKHIAIYRLVLAVAAGLMLAAYFAAHQPATPQLALISSLSVIAFAVPAGLAVLRAQGRARGLLILALLGLYALLVESGALLTGLPYGTFSYGDVLGGKVFGLTPWTVAFAYPPILLLAYTVAARLVGRGQPPLRLALLTAGLAALTATACDLVLDPAAVRLGFWAWAQPGGYYGVPLVNFGGWLLTSFMGGLLLHWLWSWRDVPASLGYSGLAIVWFWTAANLWLGQWLPAAFGLLFCPLLLAILRRPQGTIRL